MDLTPQEEKEFEEWIKKKKYFYSMYFNSWIKEGEAKLVCDFKSQLYQIFKTDQGNKEVINPL